MILSCTNIVSIIFSMSRTYLHIQQAKFKEGLHEKELGFVKSFGNYWYGCRLPHGKKRGWHKLANLYEWGHERKVNQLNWGRGKMNLRHKIAKKEYLKEEYEYGLCPMFRPKFRTTKRKNNDSW